MSNTNVTATQVQMKEESIKSKGYSHKGQNGYDCQRQTNSCRGKQGEKERQQCQEAIVREKGFQQIGLEEGREDG